MVDDHRNFSKSKQVSLKKKKIKFSKSLENPYRETHKEYAYEFLWGSVDEKLVKNRGNWMVADGGGEGGEEHEPNLRPIFAIFKNSQLFF